MRASGFWRGSRAPLAGPKNSRTVVGRDLVYFRSARSIGGLLRLLCATRWKLIRVKTSRTAEVLGAVLVTSHDLHVRSGDREPMPSEMVAITSGCWSAVSVKAKEKDPSPKAESRLGGTAGSVAVLPSAEN